MAFRANEQILNGRRSAMGKLLGRSIDPDKREHSTTILGELIEKYGPAIETYPHWHPFVAHHKDLNSSAILPGEGCGFRGLDHTIHLRHAFITCPYDGGEAILESVARLPDNIRGIASITAEKIDAQLYHPNAQPILVVCEWQRRLNQDGTIPTALAVPLLLERELPCWRSAQVAETWKTMAPYILGRPSGSRSSLFVNEETGQALKTLWNSLINTGMFGPVRVGTW